jgi:hypothetical protein
MAGLTSKRKGRRGEIEVRDLLQTVVTKVYTEANKPPPVMKRNLEQVREGGADIAGLEWLALEVKYQEKENINAWWNQAKAQANGDARIPVLVHRANNNPWRCRMYGYLQPPGSPLRVVTTVDIPVEAFLAYVELRLRHQLQLNGKS